MAFQLNRFIAPTLLWIGSLIAIFLLFPLQPNTTERVYDYETHRDEFKQEVSYLPLIFSAIATIGIFAWFSNEEENLSETIVRDLEDVLGDPKSEPQCSAFHIYAPFGPKIQGDYELGDWPQGTIGVGTVKNAKQKLVYVMYVANQDYATTKQRYRRRKKPIMKIDYSSATIEDFIRAHKPRLTAPAERQMENVLRNLRGSPEERREYIRRRAEAGIKEEDEEYGY